MNMLVEIAGDTAAQICLQSQSKDEYVCWSRMQAEAGQQLDAIIARKELERRAGDGCFLWGVGNPPAVLARTLARAGIPVRAIFSIMKSKPKAVDVAPARTVAWRRYVDAQGTERALPPYALVTSRGDSSTGAKRAHYALMCHSTEPLSIRRGAPFDPTAFRNAGGTGAPVGASQVTALLRRVAEDSSVTSYEENVTAWLAASYWVRLIDPVELDAPRRALLTTAAQGSVRRWCEAVTLIRSGPPTNESVKHGELL